MNFFKLYIHVLSEYSYKNKKRCVIICDVVAVQMQFYYKRLQMLVLESSRCLWPAPKVKMKKMVRDNQVIVTSCGPTKRAKPLNVS